MDIKLNNGILDNSLIQNKVDNIKLSNTNDLHKKNISIEDKNEYAKVARNFESLFIHMMYKQMKEAMLEEPEKEGDLSFGSDTLEGYSDLMFSDELSKVGNGIGIADLIYQNFTGEKLNGISVNYSASNSPVQKLENPKSKNSDNTQISSEIKNTESSNYSNPKVSGNFLERVSKRLDNYSEIISQAAKKHNVPEHLIKGIITAESAALNTAKSQVGAKGLMQLMDGTAKDLGVRNSYDPAQNIMGGTKYISKMLEMFDGNLEHALAAYNAGPGNVKKYSGIPPFAETQAYVKRVKKYSNIFASNNNEVEND